MNRSISWGAAIFALGLSSAATAQSTVTLSGILDTGVSWTTHAGDGTQSLRAMSDSILGVSNIGFSGKEDLGGGLTALFNLQMGLNPSSGQFSSSGTAFSRNAYVGLSSSAGTLTVGRQWNFNDDWLVGSVFKGGYNAGSVFKFSEFDAVSEIYNNTINSSGATESLVNTTSGAIGGGLPGLDQSSVALGVRHSF